MNHISNRITSLLKQHKFFIAGFLVIFFFLFSRLIFGYQLSYSNLMYTSDPFDAHNVSIDGPRLSDVADSEYPRVFKTFYNEDKISFWNNDIALGTTSDDVRNIMNPLKYIYLLPIGLASFLKVFTEFLIGFASMYLFMRSLDVRKFSSAITGILYTFSSVIVVWLGWAHSDVAVLAPLLFFSIEKMIQTIKVKYALLCSVVIYLMLIAGMPTYAAYFLYLTGVYIVYFTIRKHWNNKKNILIISAMFTASVIAGTLVSLPYTYTLLQSVGGYAASRTAYAEATLGFEYLRTFLFPYVRDNLAVFTNEGTLYVGLLPMVLLPYMFINNKKKNRNGFFLISSFVLFLLIFTQAFTFIFAKLPAINTSMKYRVITLLMFTLCILAGLALNDYLTNTADYCNKKWLLYVQIIWSVGIFAIASFDIFRKNIKEFIFVLLIIIVFNVCLIFLKKKQTTVLLALLTACVILDCGGFAKEYLPWISREVSVIPEPTDSVEYLMEHTDDTERIAALGTWTLFPNSASYYGLNDARMHNFVATNPDITSYYEAIDDTCYTTNTRVAFNKIDNYNLLQYLGVKHIFAAGLGTKEVLASIDEEKTSIGNIPDNAIIRQPITIKDGKLAGFDILFATMGTQLTCTEDIYIRLRDMETEKEVAVTTLPVNQVIDNAYQTVYFDAATEIAAGKYFIELEFPALGGDTITLWRSLERQTIILVNEQGFDGSLVMNCIYEPEEYALVHRGKDGLAIGELQNYTQKFELAADVQVHETEASVLDAMKASYKENTLFLTKDTGIASYEAPLSDDEEIEVISYENDSMKVKCSTSTERMLLINDYYDKDWKAYVNGKETKIHKANYLMRAVKLPAGEDITVELKYEPQTLYTTFYLAIAGMVIWLATLIILVVKNKGTLLKKSNAE